MALDRENFPIWVIVPWSFSKTNRPRGWHALCILGGEQKDGVQMKSLAKYGTYGFLSTLMATQLAIAPRVFASESADRAQLDAKKPARSMRRDLKKSGRKVTGQENSWDDAKDELKDGASNAKDEAHYQARKLQRKTR